MKRLTGLAIFLVLAFVGAGIGLRLAGHDPAVWHVDPASAKRPGRDNDFLIAPEGAVAATPDAVSAVHPVAPDVLLFQFDAVARNSPRVSVVAGSVEEGRITYVQRSLVLGFPDYITVNAVPAGDGAALVVWSRSRYGYSDVGVNRERVERWLAGMGG